jgi:luciferase family oxidoreductase group 1
MPGIASSSPAVVIAHLAAATTTLRLGSGGVMLPNHAPLVIAEQFGTLQALHPGRIDLGIGRAPGSDGRTAVALAQGRPLSIDHFPEQLRDLAGFLFNALPEDHPYAGVRAMPQGPGAPEVWLLGSSGHSAAYAAHFGFAFSFAHFINQEGGAEIMAGYRQYFNPLLQLQAPLGSVAVRVICADTEAEAQRLASSFGLMRLRMERGQVGPVPSVEEALAYPYSEAERAHVAALIGRGVVGDPRQVKERLEQLAAAYDVDEVVVVTVVHDPRARRRSYELLAEAFDLQQDQAARSSDTSGKMASAGAGRPR